MQRTTLSALVVVGALLAIGLVGAALVAPIGADNPDESADRSITVDATGGADAAPDQAVVHVAVTADGDDPAAIRDELADGAAELRSNLADAGVADDAYETSEYRIREQRRHPEDRSQSEYEGTHTFEVTLDDPDQAGAVIDAAADANAEIGRIEFSLSEARRTELRETAIENAMGDARTQADSIAANGNLQVTSVDSVDASQQRYSPVRYDGAVAEAADDTSTTIDTGDVSVTYQVRVTYNATAV